MVAKMQREHANLTLVPQPLPNLDVSGGTGTAISCFHYYFEVPWQDLEKTDLHKALATFFFGSGQTLVFFDPTLLINPLKVMNLDAAKKGTNLPEVFGPDAVRSNYSLLKTELVLTPNQFSLFMSQREAVADTILLTFKSMEILHQHAVYSFSLGSLRCFQMGDLSSDTMVGLDCFDASDRRFEFWFARQHGKSAPILQSDINRVVKTLRPTVAPGK